MHHHYQPAPPAGGIDIICYENHTCGERMRGRCEAMGLSQELRRQGYGLLCVARAIGPLEAETQDEDEVYELQFGQHFGRGKVSPGLPIEEE